MLLSDRCLRLFCGAVFLFCVSIMGYEWVGNWAQYTPDYHTQVRVSDKYIYSGKSDTYNLKLRFFPPNDPKHEAAEELVVPESLYYRIEIGQEYPAIYHYIWNTLFRQSEVIFTQLDDTTLTLPLEADWGGSLFLVGIMGIGAFMTFIIATLPTTPWLQVAATLEEWRVLLTRYDDGTVRRLSFTPSFHCADGIQRTVQSSDPDLGRGLARAALHRYEQVWLVTRAAFLFPFFPKAQWTTLNLLAWSPGLTAAPGRAPSRMPSLPSITSASEANVYLDQLRRSLWARLRLPMAFLLILLPLVGGPCLALLGLGGVPH